jgi:uncharacterized membrane-anchored protein
MTLQGYKLNCSYTASEAIGSLIIWVLLSIVTLGLALFVMPYYILKAPINRTELLDNTGRTVARLHVEVDLASIIGHAVIWFFLVIVTLGLAFLIYYPAVIKRLLNAVEIQPTGGGMAVPEPQYGPSTRDVQPV